MLRARSLHEQAIESLTVRLLRLGAAAMPMICKYEANGVLGMIKMLMRESATKFMKHMNIATKENDKCGGMRVAPFQYRACLCLCESVSSLRHHPFTALP